jgi:hypothetical protein
MKGGHDSYRVVELMMMMTVRMKINAVQPREAKATRQNFMSLSLSY